MLSCEFCEIFKNTFFYRAFPVAASESSNSFLDNSNMQPGSILGPITVGYQGVVPPSFIKYMPIFFDILNFVMHFNKMQ